MAVDFLGTTHTQAYNRYPRLVKCLCEPNEEECCIDQGSLRGNLHVYFFLSSHTCTPQEVSRDWKNPVILCKAQLLAPTCHCSLPPPSLDLCIPPVHHSAPGTGTGTKRTHLRSDDCPGWGISSKNLYGCSDASPVKGLAPQDHEERITGRPGL